MRRSDRACSLEGAGCSGSQAGPAGAWLRAAAGTLAALAFGSSPASAWAPDHVFLEAGQSQASHCDLRLFRLGAQNDMRRLDLDAGGWHLGGRWEFSAGYWDNASADRTSPGLVDLGFTPVFRLEWGREASLAPYLEAGVGVHLLSHASVSEFRRFGSAFQFGDHLGAGIRFGRNGRFDLSCRLQHLSNAGIKDPNRGINYNILRFGCRL